MSIHFGGKKVQEMYWNGQKIKEAWYEGRKVYSAGRGPQHMGPWHINVDYIAGDTVIGGPYGDIKFRCLQSHRSSLDDRPYYGVLESIYWEII